MSQPSPRRLPEDRPIKLPERTLAMILGAVVMFLVVGGAGLWLLVNSEHCLNDQLRETLSPNGRMKAVQFRRSCGATTGYSTHVSIVPAEAQAPKGPGNVYVLGGEVAVMVRWVDDGRLAIKGGDASQAFHRTGEIGGVRVSYE